MFPAGLQMELARWILIIIIREISAALSAPAAPSHRRHVALHLASLRASELAATSTIQACQPASKLASLRRARQWASLPLSQLASLPAALVASLESAPMVQERPLCVQT